MGSDRTPADALARARWDRELDPDHPWHVAWDDVSPRVRQEQVEFAEVDIELLAAAGFRVVPEPDDTTRAARIVATHWRDQMMAADGVLRGCAHPLAMVLAALDGETDPVQLGVDLDVFSRDVGVTDRLSGDGEERPAQCPTCGSEDPATRLPVKRPDVHIEGGARVCRFCNRTLTFNFMRNKGGDCDCARAVEDAACSGSWHGVGVSR